VVGATAPASQALSVAVWPRARDSWSEPEVAASRARNGDEEIVQGRARARARQLEIEADGPRGNITSNAVSGPALAGVRRGRRHGEDAGEHGNGAPSGTSVPRVSRRRRALKRKHGASERRARPRFARGAERAGRPAGCADGRPRRRRRVGCRRAGGRRGRLNAVHVISRPPRRELAPHRRRAGRVQRAAPPCDWATKGRRGSARRGAR